MKINKKIQEIAKENYSRHKNTITDIIWRSLQVLGKEGITFLIFFLCAKFLTPYDFGVYNYILAIIFSLVAFCDFGISEAVSKYIAEYNALNKSKKELIFFNAGILIFLLALIVIILLIIIGPHYFGEKFIYMLLLLPLLLLIPITSLYDGIYRGLKRFKQLSIISLLVGLISIPFVYLLTKRCGLIGALIAQDLFYLFLFLALFLSYKGFKLKIDKEIMLMLGKYSALIGIANLGSLLYTKFNTLILGHFNYINEIAYYELANKLFLLLALPVGIFSQVVAPDVTKFFASNEYIKIRLKLKKYFIYSIISGIIISIISCLAIEPFTIHFLPNYDNDSFYLFFRLLLIIFPIRIFGTILTISFIIAAGQAKIIAYNNLIFGILNVVIDIIFIYKFGPIGVIYSAVLLGYISVLTAYFFFQKNTTFQINKNYKS